MRKVLPKEIDIVKTNLKENDNLKTYFSNLFPSIFDIEERDKQHPLFWAILDSGTCFKLSNNLSKLESKYDKFNSFLKRMKAANDRYNFHSCFSEAEVLAHYYETYRIEDLFSEPDVNGKKPELKIIIGGEEYFLEVLTIFEDEMEKNMNKIQDRIRKKMDDIDQPFIISFSIGNGFTENDIERFTEFIKQILKKQNSIEIDKSYEYLDGEVKISEVRFHENDGKRGYVGAMSSIPTFREVELSGRIKHKILTKTEQLPENTKNIIVVDLSYVTGDLIDIYDAIYGQLSVEIDRNTSKVRKVRLSNGIIHHEKGRRISLVIPYVRQDYASRMFLFNPLANNEIDNSLKEKL